MDVVRDPNKARANRRKHGVAFPDAEAVLFDLSPEGCDWSVKVRTSSSAGGGLISL